MEGEELEKLKVAVLHVFASRGNFEGMPHDWIARDLPDFDDQSVCEAEFSLQDDGLVLRFDLISYIELTPEGRRRVEAIASA